jgi:glycosyltransferase involved in cell wall biosynthesis
VKPIVILIPCFNDWSSIRMLLCELDKVLSVIPQAFEVMIIDDGSTVDSTEAMDARDRHCFTRLQVLKLRRNLGHQRAIAIGLAYVAEHCTCKAVVVMDADGEDTPQDVSRLLQMHEQTGGSMAIFAQRTRRSESSSFRLGYMAYKILYRCLSGQSIRMGNFSLLPEIALQRVVAVSEIWNHYAAGLMRARIPYVEVTTVRGKRLDGKSTMNALSLIVHGLSAIAVYAETVGVRLLILSLSLAVPVVVTICVLIGIRMFTHLAIPGWTSSVVGMLLVVLTQLGLFSIFFIFFILSSRNSYSFLPCRDYHHYLLCTMEIGGNL